MRHRLLSSPSVMAALCLAFFAACDDGGGTPRTVATGDAGGGSLPPSGQIDPTLVGEYVNGSWVATPEYRDSVTGAFTPPSGDATALVLSADGTYLWGAHSSVGVGACSEVLEFQDQGRWSVAGGKITFSPSSPGRGENWNSCTPENRAIRPGDPNPRSFVVILSSLFYLQLWDAAPPAARPAGQACARDEDCLGRCEINPFGPSQDGTCVGSCPTRSGCLELRRQSLGCGAVFTCTSYCAPETVAEDGNIPPYGPDDVQECQRHCRSRDTPHADELFVAMWACFNQTSCQGETACRQVCGGQIDACLAD